MRRLFLILIFLCVPSGFAQAQDSNAAYIRWSLPEGATMHIGKGKINDTALSPDGKHLAVASAIGLWLYDTQTYEELTLLTGDLEKVPPEPFIRVAFSPDGKTLATVNLPYYDIWLWDVQTGKTKLFLRDQRSQLGIRCIEFSPDGKTLASGGFGDTVRLWNTQTGDLKAAFRSQTNGVSALTFSLDGSILATGGRGPRTGKDAKIQLWNSKTYELMTTLKGNSNTITSLAFSSDDRILISGSWNEDENIQLWHPKTAQLLSTLKGETKKETTLAISPDGETIASVSESTPTIQLWNLKTSKQKETILTNDQKVGVTTIEFSPDGTNLVSANLDGTIRFYDVETGNLKATITGHADKESILSLAFSPDGKTIASCGKWSTTIQLWNIATGKLQSTFFGNSRIVPSTVFSPNGKMLAATNGGTVLIRDVKTAVTRISLSSWQNRKNPVACLTFSPDGKILATGSANVLSDNSNQTGDSTIRLWNTYTGELYIRLIGHRRGVMSLTFSPDGKILASASKDKTIMLWDTNTYQRKFTLEKHNGVVTCVAFSPDGKTIASASKDKKIILWDTDTGQYKTILTGHGSNVTCVAFSPDGKTIVSASYDNTVRLWDLNSKNQIKVFTVNKAVHTLRFSPDGNILASGAGNGTILLWNPRH